MRRIHSMPSRPGGDARQANPRAASAQAAVERSVPIAHWSARTATTRSRGGSQPYLHSLRRCPGRFLNRRHRVDKFETAWSEAMRQILMAQNALVHHQQDRELQSEAPCSSAISQLVPSGISSRQIRRIGVHGKHGSYR